jgi:hypothetical protein
MRGLDPRIHLLREKILTKIDGLPGQAKSSPAMTKVSQGQREVFTSGGGSLA